MQTASNTLLENNTELSISFFIQYNSIPNFSNRIIDASNSHYIARISSATQAFYSLYDSSNNGKNSPQTFQTGVVYHIALTWNNSPGANRFRIYINGIIAYTAAVSTTQGSGSEWIQVGSEIAQAIDYQVSNLAIWNGYEFTATDVNNLRDNVYAPGGTCWVSERLAAAADILVVAWLTRHPEARRLPTPVLQTSGRRQQFHDARGNNRFVCACHGLHAASDGPRVRNQERPTGDVSSHPELWFIRSNNRDRYS